MERQKRGGEKRQQSGTTEEQLMYCLDFYDLKTIVQKKPEFVFGYFH